MASKTDSSKKRREKYPIQPPTLNAAKLIDAAFARPVTVTIGGKEEKMSTFRAIFLQLAQKAPFDRRALRVLGRYCQYAKERGGTGRIKLVYGPKARTSTSKDETKHD